MTQSYTAPCRWVALAAGLALHAAAAAQESGQLSLPGVEQAGGHEHATPAGASGAEDEQDHAVHLASAGKNGRQADVEVDLHDEPLRTADDRTLRFASEALGDKLVALTVAYTRCTTVCPVTAVIFSRVQRALGARMEEEVRLVTLSVDPATDTPSRLRQYAARHDAGRGWLWLTGEKPRVERVLRGIGAYTADFTDHPVMVLVGDPANGRWTRLFGFPDAKQVIAELDALAESRAADFDDATR